MIRTGRPKAVDEPVSKRENSWPMVAAQCPHARALAMLLLLLIVVACLSDANGESDGVAEPQSE